MKRIIPLILVICMLLSACGTAKQPQVAVPQEDIPVVNQPVADQPVTNLVSGQTIAPEAGTYNPGVVLVKVDGELTPDMLAKTGAVSAEPLYAGSAWHQLTLAEGVDTAEAVEQLQQMELFDAVDYDYIMQTGVVDVSCNLITRTTTITIRVTVSPRAGSIWTITISTPAAAPM